MYRAPTDEDGDVKSPLQRQGARDRGGTWIDGLRRVSQLSFWGEGRVKKRRASTISGFCTGWPGTGVAGVVHGGWRGGYTGVAAGVVSL